MAFQCTQLIPQIGPGARAGGGSGGREGGTTFRLTLPAAMVATKTVSRLLRAVRARIAPEPAQELELHTPDGVCLARDTPLAEALMPGYVFFVSKV